MSMRRNLIINGAMLALSGTPVWGLNADSASLRYRSWLVQFRRDLAQLSKVVTDVIGASEEQVGMICKNSVAPHSRAVSMVSGWMKEGSEINNARRSARRYADWSSIALLLFEDSVPVGYGGLFPEAPGSRFPSGRFSVWYMHIGGPESLQAYFDDRAQFPNYKLPPNGTLKRHTYPFLLFEDTGNTLRLAGVGAEWMGAAVYLHRKQYS